MAFTAESLPERQLRLSEIARHIRVSPATCSNWRRRHADFPRAQSINGQEVYQARAIGAWLDKRTIPAAQREHDEQSDATYGARLRRALAEGSGKLGIRDVTAESAVSLEPVRTMWPRRFRGVGITEAEFLDVVLLLVFTWICAEEQWDQILRDARVRKSEPNAQGLVVALGATVDEELRRHGLLPEASPVIARLNRARTIDIVELVTQCANVGIRGFDAVLNLFAATAAVRSDDYCTPPEVAALIGACAAPLGHPTRSIVDPFTRFGELLLAVPADANPVTVLGLGADRDTVRRANMNLIVHGLPGTARIATGRPWYRPITDRFDSVVVNPPFNVGSEADSSPRSKWLFGPPPSHNDNLAWVQAALALTTSTGRAAVLMPAAAGASADERERAIRQAMVDSGALCAVIRLPGQIFPVSAIDTALWVLRRNTEPPLGVVLIDARKMVEREHQRARPRLRNAAEIAELVRSPEGLAGGHVSELPSGGRAVLASAAAIARTNYTLIPDEYLRSAPTRAAVHRERIENRQHEAEQRVVRMNESSTAASRFTIGPRTTADDGAPTGWGEAHLSDLCTIQSGPSNARGSVMAVESGGTVPVLKPKHVRPRHILAAGIDKTSDRSAKRMAKFTTEVDDILLVRVGQVGDAAIVRDDQHGWLFSTNLIRLRIKDRSVVDPHFLLEFLLRKDILEQIRSRAAVNSVPSISSEALGRQQIALPPIDEQREMAAALRALEQKVVAFRAAAEAAEQVRLAIADGLLFGSVVVRR